MIWWFGVWDIVVYVWGSVEFNEGMDYRHFVRYLQIGDSQK